MVDVPSVWLMLWPNFPAEELQREGSQVPQTTCLQLPPSCILMMFLFCFHSHFILFCSLGFCFCRGSVRVLPITCPSSVLREGSCFPLPAAPTPDAAGHLAELPSNAWDHPHLYWPSEEHQEPRLWPETSMVVSSLMSCMWRRMAALCGLAASPEWGVAFRAPSVLQAEPCAPACSAKSISALNCCFAPCQPVTSGCYFKTSANAENFYDSRLTS